MTFSERNKIRRGVYRGSRVNGHEAIEMDFVFRGDDGVF